jgi:hypothetical protein
LILASALPAFVITRRVRQFGWDYYLTYGPGYWMFPTVLEQSQTVAGFDVRVERDRRELYGEKIMQVRWGGDDVFKETGDHWYIGGYVRGDGRAVEVGQDMTGNGIPDLILQETPEGAHPPSTFHILELRPGDAQLIATIHGVSDLGNIRDVDGDGTFEIVAYDSTFAYWNTYYAASPSPRVVYAVSADVCYRVSPEAMRRFLLTADEFAVRAALVQEQLMNAELAEDGSPSLWDCSDLWGTMLDLIYSGDSDRAYEFVELTWPKQRSGKETFIRSFQQQLGRSPYREMIEVMGHPPLPRHLRHQSERAFVSTK